MAKINYDVPLRTDKLNDNIKGHILSDEEMIALGFEDRGFGSWMFFELLDQPSKGFEGTSFSMRIEKDTEEVFIDVLDEAYLQPYDYQSILQWDPNHKFANFIHKRVQNLMKKFLKAGVITGYTPGDYI